MADENVDGTPVGAQTGADGGDRVGFCQDCGRPLTASTVRAVGSGVFCEPCLERRVANSAAGSPGTTAGVPPASPYQPSFGPATSNPFKPGYPPPDGVFPPIDGSTPHPVLAGFLGLIPGVGAMYNGQFAKGFVHLIVFVVLVSLSDNVNGVFGLLVAGWIFFMSFEAYHTAKARRDGLPLPDPFGLNNIGDRMGLRNWTGPTRPPGTTGATPYASTVAGQPNGQAQPYRASDWVGYVPPGSFGSTVPPDDTATATAYIPITEMPVPPPPADAPYAPPHAQDLAAEVRTQAVRDAGYPPVAPYASTYTGPGVQPVLSPDLLAASTPSVRRFPAGAVWLIGLGILFLLGDLSPDMRYSWRWLLPVFLAVLAIWLFVHRASAAGRTGRSTAADLVCIARMPVLLLTVAVLFTLQTAHWQTLGQTWPVFFIVMGALLLLERTIGRPTSVPVVPAIDASGFGQTPGYVPGESSVPVSSAAWTAPGDADKGGPAR